MEDVEKPPILNSAVDDVKSSTVCGGTVEICVTAMESDVCHKSNGVVVAENIENIVELVEPANTTTALDVEVVAEVIHKSPEGNTAELPNKVSEVGDAPVPENVADEVITDAACKKPEAEVDANIKSTEKSVEIIDHLEDTVIADLPEVEESIVEIDGIVESTNDGVTLKTEIVVESNVNDNMSENKEEDIQNVTNESATNMLNELGQSIELSEMLRSSDTNENNNSASKQEVFNKEELLDILEGNDGEDVQSINKIREITPHPNPLEQQLALQQLSRLKRVKKRRYERKHIVHRKETECKVEENIVTELVKEWEDDEPVQMDQPKITKEDTENQDNNSDVPVKAQDNISSQDKTSARSSLDSTTSEKQTPNLSKSSDEGLPQRRLGRIIKKKVIFDPDNPDTFTKGKSALKNKDFHQDKDQLPYKKIKGESTSQQPKARSPMSKLQWKKPTPKNSKRLTEVDKLLMDEGAVNMIYQLTPEAAKGKKNIKTKAEFIKNLQRSTPDSKEMKFRERKKDSKSEDGEPRKIAGGKQRPSLSSSVKSPSVCEDFEAHSADDSIIYRRHSSSSYSSSCMSPRRLSDVESGAVNNVGRISQQPLENQDKSTQGDNKANVSDTFMTDNSTPKKLINKNDCLSIKEKLNSKLSLALKKQGLKRKQDSTVLGNSLKQKKVLKQNEKPIKCDDIIDYKHLSCNINNRLGEICIKKSGSHYNIEVLRELEKALTYINSREDVSVTLLMSECGIICSGLDLRPLLIDDLETRTKCAFDLAESVRSLLFTVNEHSKLLCTGVGSSCSSVGLALVAMSDVTLASEYASFALEADMSSSQQSIHTPLVPGLSVLIASSNSMSKSLLSDLMVFGHKLSASDALRYGLVSRTLWPENFHVQLRNIAKDIAIQPIQNISLKKQLLDLKKNERLISNLEKERDMLVQYWVSPEGQKLIHTAYETT